jgi:hypothetical protein
MPLAPEPVAELSTDWQWLVERPHSWRRQLWIKGRKLLASAVWLDAQANGLSAAETAENWGLPLPAVEEALAYSEAHRALIEAEANEEHQRLLAEGIRPEGFGDKLAAIGRKHGVTAQDIEQVDSVRDRNPAKPMDIP